MKRNKTLVLNGRHARVIREFVCYEDIREGRTGMRYPYTLVVRDALVWRTRKTMHAGIACSMMTGPQVAGGAEAQCETQGCKTYQVWSHQAYEASIDNHAFEACEALYPEQMAAQVDRDVHEDGAQHSSPLSIRNFIRPMTPEEEAQIMAQALRDKEWSYGALPLDRDLPLPDYHEPGPAVLHNQLRDYRLDVRSNRLRSPSDGCSFRKAIKLSALASFFKAEIFSTRHY
jgi:hypothetical protein